MSGLESHSYRSYWPLAVLLVLSAVLRLWQINESLWLDELHTAWVVAGGPLDIFERARIGNHSPVYFFLPWMTTSLFGMSEWALRLPSLLAGLALVASVYGMTIAVTRSVLGATTAALLASLDGNFLFYATEARPYACVQLVAAIQLGLFWQLQANANFKLRTFFVLTTCLLIYLHYTAILVLSGQLVAQGVWAWLALEREDSPSRYSLRALLCDLVIVAFLSLPGMLHLVEIASHRGNWQSFVRDTDLTSAARWFSLASYVVIPAIAFTVTKLLKRRAGAAWHGPTRTGFGVLLICWFAVPVLLAWIATNWGLASLYFPRYLIGFAMAPMLLGGLLVGSIARRWRVAAMAIVVASACCAGTTCWQLYHFGRPLGERREDWRSAVAWLTATYDAAPDDVGDSSAAPVFVRSGLLEADNLRSDAAPLFKQYCLCPINSIYRFKHQDVLIPLPTHNPGDLSKQSIDLIRRYGVGYFVINAPAKSHEPIRRQIGSALQAAGLQVQLRPSHSFGSVRVWRVEVP